MKSARNMTRGHSAQRGKARWAAVAGRDASADGEFVFAVRSTGIFCRPSCPARRPRRSQVVFLPRRMVRSGLDFAPACVAGRCRNGGAVPIRNSRWSKMPAGKFPAPSPIASRENISLLAQCRDSGLSMHQLRRAFRQCVGCDATAIRHGAEDEQLEKAIEKRRECNHGFIRCGIRFQQPVYERTPQELGMTPATYRKGGEGMRIGFTMVSSSVGRVLIGATEKGIAAVYLGESEPDSPEFCIRNIRRAEIRRDSGRLARSAAKILRHLSGVSAKWICHWMCRRQHFSGASGRLCKAFHMARRVLTSRLPGPSKADGHAGGGAGLRHEPCLYYRAVPSRGSRRWQTRRLSLGCGA